MTPTTDKQTSWDLTDDLAARLNIRFEATPATAVRLQPVRRGTVVRVTPPRIAKAA